jgi:hydrogenase maturation protease
VSPPHAPDMETPPPTSPALAPTGGRTVVLGLGNPVLCDDGVGLAVVSTLRELLVAAPIPGVDVLASTRAGFELIDLLRDYRRAVLVDCLTLPEPQPGRVQRLGLDDVAGASRLVNVHELSAGMAFQLAERMGIPMPAEVEILAVEAADTWTIVEGLTPAVEAAVGPLAREIYEDLQRRAPATEPPDTDDFRNRRAFYAPDVD